MIVNWIYLSKFNKDFSTIGTYLIFLLLILSIIRTIYAYL